MLEISLSLSLSLIISYLRGFSWIDDHTTTRARGSVSRACSSPRKAACSRVADIYFDRGSFRGRGIIIRIRKKKNKAHSGVYEIIGV